MDFTGKVAFITGGAQGFGRAFAETILADGGAVGLFDINAAKTEATAAEMRAKGGKALALPGNVTEEADIEREAKRLAREFGGIDILINNAAKHLMEYSVPPLQMPRDKWRLMLEVNVTGIVNCTAACRPHMKARGGGVVLNISSIAGFAPTGSYGVSKLAVRGLTIALAHELAADKIRVVAIAPGAMATEAAVEDLPPDLLKNFRENLQLVKRAGVEQDIVKAMRFLCSDNASFITGETLMVSGGYPLHL